MGELEKEIKKLKTFCEQSGDKEAKILDILLCVFEGAAKTNDLIELKDELLNFAERKQAEYLADWKGSISNN